MADIPSVAAKPAFVEPISIPGGAQFDSSGAESVQRGLAAVNQGLRAVSRAASVFAEQREVESQNELRARLSTIDREMYSAYSQSRRDGTFNPVLLQGQLERRLQETQSTFGEIRGDNALYEQLRGTFSKMLENQLTRQADKLERARLVSARLTTTRAFESAVAEDPNITEEAVDQLATEFSSRLRSDINPAAGEAARVELFDKLLTTGRRAIAERERIAEERRSLMFRMNIEGELDRVERRVASGEISATVGAGLSDALAKKLEGLPVSRETVALSDSARNLQTSLVRLSQTGSDRASKAQALAMRLAVEERADEIQRAVINDEITPGQATEALDELAKQLRAGEITPTSVELVDAMRNLGNTLQQQQHTEDDAAASEADRQRSLARRLRAEQQADKVMAGVESGDIPPGNAAELIQALTEAVEAGELTPMLVEVSDSLRGLTNKLLGRQRRRDEDTRRREREASMAAAKVTYAEQQSSVNRMLTVFGKSSYRTEEEFLVATKEITDAAVALPEATVEQIGYKDEVFGKLTAGAARFTDERRQQTDDVKDITYDAAFNDLLQDIRSGDVRTSVDLDERIEAITAAVTEGGAKQELLSRISGGVTRAKTLYETVTHNRRFQPIIDNTARNIAALGPIPPERVAEEINTAVDQAVGQEEFNPRQAVLLRTAAFRQLAPELEEAMDARYDRMYTSAQGRVEQEFSVASAAIKNDEDYDFDALGNRVGSVLGELPEEMQRDLSVGVVEPLAAKLGAQAHDKELLERRAANKAILEENIIGAGVVVRGDPGAIQAQFQQLQVQFNSADLDPQDATALLDDAQKVLLEQHLAGSLLQMLEDPTRRDEIDEFVARAKASPAFNPIGDNIDDIVASASREWRQNYNDRSRAKVEERLQNLAGETFYDQQEINQDAEVSTADKTRYNNAFDAYNEKVVAAHSFQDLLDANDTVVTKEDAGDYDAWWQSINGGQMLRENPVEVIGDINQAGYMTKAMVKEAWSVVTGGQTEEAQQMLSTLSYLEPDVLAASLSSAQHEQFVFWKYDRKARTPEETMVAMRVLHEGAPSAIRDQLEREYTRLSFEEEYASREVVFDILSVEEAPENSFGLNYAYRDYVTLQRHMFLRGMAWDDAEEAAVELVQREWGLNVDGSTMYLPPGKTAVPKLFNPDTEQFDHGWILQEIEAEVAGDSKYNVPPARPVTQADARGGETRLEIPTPMSLFSDETTRRENNAGQTPSYLVQFVDEQGLVQFLTKTSDDGSEETVRFRPIPGEEKVSQQQMLIEEAHQARQPVQSRAKRVTGERAPDADPNPPIRGRMNHTEELMRSSQTSLPEVTKPAGARRGQISKRNPNANPNPPIRGRGR